MKSKKAQGVLECVLRVVFILFLIGGIMWITTLFLNKGSSVDYPYNVEQNKYWHKLWLKDDHTTVYCFDDEKFISTIEQAKKENKKVKVSYQEYLFRGFLCSSGSYNIGEVVITNIEVVN